MARKVFADLDILTAAEVNQYLMDQAVMTFANAAARDAAIPVAQRKQGMVAYMLDTHLAMQYHTIGAWSGWAPLPGTGVAAWVTYSGQSNNVVTATNTAIRWSGGVDKLGVYVADTTRFTPNVAGTYAISGVAVFALNSTGIRNAFVAKNGTAIDGSFVSALPTTGIVNHALAIPPALVPMNGTTDYVEIYQYHNAGVALSNVGANPQRNSLTVVYAGP